MAKAVGLSRKITLRWLNKAVDLLDENLSEEEYKTALNEYLSYEIDSAIVLRKTREILMHAWVYDEDLSVTEIRNTALKLIKKHPDYDVAIHWCMLLLNFPVLVDLAKLMGRIAEFNDVIVLKQLKQKLYDEWGERSTLYHSTDKIIATMKELGVISAERPGNYHIVPHEIKNENVAKLLLQVAMKVDGGSYYSFTETNTFGVMFPFKYSVSKESIMEDEHFLITTFGGEMTVSLKND